MKVNICNKKIKSKENKMATHLTSQTRRHFRSFILAIFVSLISTYVFKLYFEFGAICATYRNKFGGDEKIFLKYISIIYCNAKSRHPVLAEGEDKAAVEKLATDATGWLFSWSFHRRRRLFDWFPASATPRHPIHR